MLSATAAVATVTTLAPQSGHDTVMTDGTQDDSERNDSRGDDGDHLDEIVG